MSVDSGINIYTCLVGLYRFVTNNKKTMPIEKVHNAKLISSNIETSKAESNRLKIRIQEQI